MSDGIAEGTPPQQACGGVRLSVFPGVCGFGCTVVARRVDSRTVALEILGADCRQLQRLSAQLRPLGLRELFTPVSRNPVYAAAEKSGCHPSCVLPAALLKAAEVALEMALARDVTFHFESGT